MQDLILRHALLRRHNGTYVPSRQRKSGRDLSDTTGVSRLLNVSPEYLLSVVKEDSAGLEKAIDGWLFTAPRGGRVRYNNWRARTWTRIEEMAGIGDVHPHDLRHTLTTRLFVVDGWTVPQVQAFLGHVDPTVTLRVYAHVMSETLPAPSSGHFVGTMGS